MMVTESVMTTEDFINESNATYGRYYTEFLGKKVPKIHEIIHAAWEFLSENGGQSNNYLNLFEYLIVIMQTEINSPSDYPWNISEVQFRVVTSFLGIRSELQVELSDKTKKLRYPKAVNLETSELIVYSAVITKLSNEAIQLKQEGIRFANTLIKQILNHFEIDLHKYKRNKQIKQQVIEQVLKMPVTDFRNLCLTVAEIDPASSYALKMHQAKCLHILYGHRPEFCAYQLGIDFPNEYQIFDADGNLLVEKAYALLSNNQLEEVNRLQLTYESI